MRIAVVAAGLVLAMSAQAGEFDHYRLSTAADLAKVCSTPASARDGVAAAAFCHGVLAGSYGYFVASTPAADRYVCPPAQGTTRSQVAAAFVGWMKTHPQYEGDAAIDALFRFGAEAYPCKR
jgi:hypothetical protein